MTQRLKHRPRKTILLPVVGSVDITPVRDVVDTPAFQLLRSRLQLGEVRTVYPGATHSRLEHSLGTYKWTHRRMLRLEEWNLADKQDLLDARMFGLTHDIGHGPRSHLTDSLVKTGHEHRAVLLLEQLREQIANCGANPNRVIAMMKREDPLHAVVTNTPLGTDKLNYLAIDAYHSGIQGMVSEAPFLDNVYYLEGQLVADAKIFEETDSLSKFYGLMYKRVYHRPAVVVTERFEQRMMSIQLGLTGDEAEYTEEELVVMTDSDLDYHMAHSSNPIVREEHQRLTYREQPYPALVFQDSPYHCHNWAGGRHPMRHCEAPMGLLESKQLSDPNVLYRLEREIEQALGLPLHSVLAAAPVQARRFLPKSCLFLTDNQNILSLEEMAPTLWKALTEEAKRHAVFYLCNYKDDCLKLANDAAIRKVTEIVEQYV